MLGVGFFADIVLLAFGLLGDDHERPGVEGHAREDQVQQDPRDRIEGLAFGEVFDRFFGVGNRVVDQYPADDDRRADNDELHGAHARGGFLSEALHEGIAVEVL